MKMTEKELYEEFKWNCPECKLTQKQFKEILNQYGYNEEILKYESDEQIKFYNYVGEQL